MTEEKRVADYFVYAGLPDNPVPVTEFSHDVTFKYVIKQDPVVDIAIINYSLGELPPSDFTWLRYTPSGLSADLNHGGIRTSEMYLCYRRGRDKPPLVDIG